MVWNMACNVLLGSPVSSVRTNWFVRYPIVCPAPRLLRTSRLWDHALKSIYQAVAQCIRAFRGRINGEG